MGFFKKLVDKTYMLKQKRAISESYSIHDDYNDIHAHLRNIYEYLKEFNGENSCEVIKKIQEELDKIELVCIEN